MFLNGFYPILPSTVTCKLSLRISELVPVREDGTDVARIQLTTLHEPRNAIYNLLPAGLYLFI